jgi:hypothetical protein
MKPSGSEEEVMNPLTKIILVVIFLTTLAVVPLTLLIAEAVSAKNGEKNRGVTVEQTDAPAPSPR